MPDGEGRYVEALTRDFKEARYTDPGWVARV
jgi:hypothetical protein